VVSAVIKFELRRAFANRLFVLALSIGVLIVLSHIIGAIPQSIQAQEMFDLIIAKGGYPESLFNHWIGGRGDILQATLYFFILPLLVCIPFADTLFTDRRDGYARNVVTRVPQRHYYVAKTLSVFLAAAVVAVIPLILDLFLTAMLFPAVIPVPAAGTFPIFEFSMWSDLYYSAHFLYIVCYLALIALFSGLIATIALVFTYLVTNRFLVLLAPFILCVFADFMLNSLGGWWFQFSPISFLRPDQPGAASFLVIAAEFIVLAALIMAFIAVRARRDEAV
jgi:hypothetical protein